MEEVFAMEAPPFLAHISDDGRTQTVLAHLQGTAALAKKFAGTFGGEAQAELAALAHDIGKCAYRLNSATTPKSRICPIYRTRNVIY